MDNKNGTKYPIVLVHGMGIRDARRFNAWGRVPAALRDAGFAVYHGGQDANGRTEDNALALKGRILDILAESGCEKVNIIAHSKGGLDSRYMISHLDMGDKVASLTTLSTPHHGSRTMDVLLKIPGFLLRFGSRVTDIIMRLGGDRRPGTYEVINSFSTAAAEEFNRRTPDHEGVYYQSYGFYMPHWYSDIAMVLPYLVTSAIDGKTDGLIAPRSAMWGNYRGAYRGNTSRGVSHCDEVDLRRRPLTKKGGEHISDITRFYVGMAEELGEMGF